MQSTVWPRNRIGNGSPVGPVSDALLGLVPTPRPRWSEVLADFFELTRDRLKGKAADQVKRWEDPRKLAVDNMVAVFGDKPIDKLDRADALAFRNGGPIGSRPGTTRTRQTSNSVSPRTFSRRSTACGITASRTRSRGYGR